MALYRQNSFSLVDANLCASSSVRTYEYAGIEMALSRSFMLLRLAEKWIRA
jgi:hypothetical protein